MNRSYQAVLFGVLVVGSSNLWAQNTQRGAVLGGLGGAIAGAIIGENNDKPAEGAAIGAAIGALGGAIMGNARDKEINQQRQYYHYQPHYHQTQVATPRGAVSSADVIAMSRSGLNDSVIINQIQTRGVQRRPEVSDIITMHQQGVSDNVITSMQQAPVGGPAPTYVAPQAPTTVIVEERYPTYYAPPPPPTYYHRSHYYRRW